jgi:hypothetical protein
MYHPLDAADAGIDVPSIEMATVLGLFVEENRYATEVCMRTLALSILTTAIIVTFACSGESSPQSEASPPAAPTGAETTATDGAVIVVPGARFAAPAGWILREPSSSMRLAEAEIPGDGGPAVLTVFFFGPGGGGGTEANLQRWAGQIAAETDPVRAGFEVDGYTVSTIAVEGTLQPSRMGTGPTEAVPGSKLVGAVVEGPGGPWFFKMTGPAATVASAEHEFEAMLRSVGP